MVEKKVENLKTTELIDKLNEVKEDEEIEELEEELDKRRPFDSIENRFEGEDDGVRDKIKVLEEELEELRNQLKRHDHKEGEVIVKLT